MDDTITLDDPHTVPTRYWHLLEDGRVQCDVCPRACRLHEGQRGLCFVRARVDDQIVLTSYGRSSGFCVDPVEKKPLNHFLPGSGVVVGERDAAATQSLGRVRKGLRARGVCQSVDLPRLGDVPVLAELAGQVAACGAERQHSAAGQEVVERLLLHGVHAEPARATVGRQDDLVVHAGPDKAQPALALVQPTCARTHVALNPAVLQQVPVPRGHSVRVVESDGVVHRGCLQNSTVRPR